MALGASRQPRGVHRSGREQGAPAARGRVRGAGHQLRLYPDAPFAGVYYDKPDGSQTWSLRSIGEFDVAAVAKTFGGGGHRNAAGFARPG